MNRRCAPTLAWLVAVLLLLTISAATYLPGVSAVGLQQDLRRFPLTLAEWQGEEIDPGSNPLPIADADERLARVYRHRDGRVIVLYVEYFESQRQGRELVSYLHKEFHRRAVPIDIPSVPGRVYRVNRVLLEQAPDARVVFFWYDLNGRVVASRYLAKLATIQDALLQGQTNGALVVVSLPVPPSRDLADVSEVAVAFLHELLPLLTAYLAGGAP